MSERAFDPAAIAAQAHEHGEDALSSVIGQLAGYASACWDNLEGAGVFESTEAREAVDATLQWLSGRESAVKAAAPSAVVMEPGDRLLLLVRDDTDPKVALETARSLRDRLAQADGTTGDHISVLAGSSVVIIRAGVGADGDEPQVDVQVG